jgi:hypothetical protein
MLPAVTLGDDEKGKSRAGEMAAEGIRFHPCVKRRRRGGKSTY